MGFKKTDDRYETMYSSHTIEDENGDVDAKIYPHPESGLSEEDIKRIRDSYLNIEE
jgi:hypothetical protein